MIIFVGTKERGYFCEDVAAKHDMTCDYVDSNLHIENQVNEIMDFKEKCDCLVFDIEQYADDSDVIIDWILKIKNAVNAKIVIYAVSYSPQSEIIYELYQKEIRTFIFSTYLSEQKEDLEMCMNGYFEHFGYENRGISFEKKEEDDEPEETSKPVVKTIGIAGSIRRMGTTTQALQIVKYLTFKGYKAAYFEMNNHCYAEAVSDAY